MKVYCFVVSYFLDGDCALRDVLHDLYFAFDRGSSYGSYCHDKCDIG